MKALSSSLLRQGPPSTPAPFAVSRAEARARLTCSGGRGASIPPRRRTARGPSAVLFYFPASARIRKWHFVGGRRGEGRGRGPAGRGVGALSLGVAPPPPPRAGVWARRSARQRAGRVGTRECGLLGEPRGAGARWPPELGAQPGAQSRRHPPLSAPRHGAFAQRRRDGGGGGGSGGGGGPPRRVLVQRGGGAGPREEGPPARRHPVHALPGGRHLPLPQHLRAGIGDIRLGLRRAVRSPHRPPGQARVLCLLAEHRGGPHPDPHGHRHGGLDHEHLLGHGHGHPCQLQGAGHPTAAVSPKEPPRIPGWSHEGCTRPRWAPGPLHMLFCHLLGLEWKRGI